jgi:hypothetical protein
MGFGMANIRLSKRKEKTRQEIANELAGKSSDKELD